MPSFYTRNKKVFLYIFVIVFFLILTVILNLNLVLNIDSVFPGNDADGYQVFARPYIISNNLESLNTTDKLLHYIHPLHFFSYMTHMAILHNIFGEPLAFNLYYLSSFLFAGLGMFILIRYLTKNNHVSLIIATAFAFVPIHFAYGGGFGASFHIEWIPFLILYLLKYLNTIKIRYLFYTIPFFLLLYNEPHFILFSIIFGIILFGYFIQKHTLLKSKKFIHQLYFIIPTSLAVTLLVSYRLLQRHFAETNYLEVTIGAIIEFSADVVGYIIPTIYHPIFGTLFQESFSIYDKFDGNPAENSTYIGILFIILFIYYIAKFKTFKSLTKVWLGLLITFFFISLGPVLHIFGTIEPKIPLPYYIVFKYIPFFSNIKAIARSFIFAFIPLLIISAFVLDYLYRKINLKLIATAFLILFIIFDFWSIPTYKAYAEPLILKDLKNTEGKVAYPQIQNNYTVASQAEFYNSLHGKEVIGGYNFAREIPGFFDNLKQIPIINELYFTLPNGHYLSQEDIIRHNYPEISTKQLNKEGVDTIILQKKSNLGSREELDNFLNLKNFIEHNIRFDTKLEDKDFLRYDISDDFSDNLIISQTESSTWKNLSKSDNIMNRMINPDDLSSIKIHNHYSENRDILISFMVESRFPEDFLLLIDNQTVELLSPTKDFHYTILLQSIPPGENTLSFKALRSDADIRIKEFRYNLDSIKIPVKNKETALANFSIYSSNNPLIQINDKYRDLPINFSPHIVKETSKSSENNLNYNNKISSDIIEYVLPEIHITNLFSNTALFEEDYIINTTSYLYNLLETKDLLLFSTPSRTTLDILNSHFNSYDFSLKGINNDIIWYQKNSATEHQSPQVLVNTDQKIIKNYSGSEKSYIYKLKSDSSFNLTNLEPEPQTGTLSFEIWQGDTSNPYIGEIYLNNNLITTTEIPRKHKIVELSNLSIPYGINLLHFRFIDKNTGEEFNFDSHKLDDNVKNFPTIRDLQFIPTNNEQ